MFENIKKSFYVFTGVAFFGFLSPSLVKAQHIVTESEAGKLTLASLTAAPVIHYSHVAKHLYKNSKHVRYRTVSYQTTSNKRYISLIHKISYKQKALDKIRIRGGVYNLSAHKKSKTRRHRS